MNLGVSDHTDFRISEFDLFRDVTELEGWEHIMVLGLLLVALELSSFLDNQVFLGFGERRVKGFEIGDVLSFITVSLFIIW